MSELFTSPDEVKRLIRQEQEAKLYRESGGDPNLMLASQSASGIGNALANLLGLPQHVDPRMKQAQSIHSSTQGLNVTTAKGMQALAQRLNDQGMYKQAVQAAARAKELSKTADRKVIKGADGFNYYQDNKERVLPDVTLGNERRIVDAADGYKYYADTGERVLPGVKKDNTKEAYERGLKDKETYFGNSAKLRGEFTKESKVFNDVTDSYIRVSKSVEDPSAAGDLALIFNYMKMLDPGSVVREGEFANAQNSGSVSSVIRAKYNKALRGERLSEVQRADFYDRAQRLYSGAKEKQAKVLKRYENLANRFGLNPQDVLHDYGILKETLKNRQGKSQSSSKQELTYNPDTGRIQ